MPPLQTLLLVLQVAYIGCSLDDTYEDPLLFNEAKPFNEFNPKTSESIDKRRAADFVRFGRGMTTNPEDFDYEDLSRHTRSGLLLNNDRFVRFGRGNSDFLRFGRDRSSNFLRFGKKDDQDWSGRKKREVYKEGKRRNDYDRKNDNFMRFGRAKYEEDSMEPLQLLRWLALKANERKYAETA